MTKAKILIVDDMPENVGALFYFLDANDFELLVAREGHSALQIATQERPDLVLLDVMMPGMDGFETCHRLKQNETTRDIPVIFMTALVEPIDKIKGLELGAVDYVTKPFHQEELLARINTHITLRQLQQQLKDKNSELAVKNEELDAFAHTVAHDLKSPLNHLISLSDFLLETQAKELNAQGQHCIHMMLTMSEKMVSIIDALLLLAGISQQKIELAPLDMATIIQQVQQRLMPLLKQYQGEIILPPHWPTASGYAPWVEEIWANYLTNGLKYGGQPPRLELGALADANMIRFWVRDNGYGLSMQAQSQLFTPFTRLEQVSDEEGHGLGLSIVHRIAERLGGQVGVESQEGQGSTFYFTLPAIQ